MSWFCSTGASWRWTSPSAPLLSMSRVYQERVAGLALTLAPGRLFGTTDARCRSCFHARVHVLASPAASGAPQDAGSVQTLALLYIMLAISSSPARRPARVYPGDLAEVLRHR